jgi:hypothetical protein
MCVFLSTPSQDKQIYTLRNKLLAIFFPSLVLARSNVRQPTIKTAHPYGSASLQCLHIYITVTTWGAWKQFCYKLRIKRGFEWTDKEQSVFTVRQVAGWTAANTDMRTDWGRGSLLHALARAKRRVMWWNSTENQLETKVVQFVKQL